jgi:hypothetical protein
MASFLKSLIVSVSVPIAFALIRRWLPQNTATEINAPDDDRELPYGVAGLIMWIQGLLMVVGGYFALVGINHWIGGSGKPALETVFPETAIWWFLPGFASLLLPWIVTLWLLRRFGYAGQAARIVAKGNEKTGFNGERVMHLLGWFMVLPIGLFTIAALPMHLSVYADEIHVTHYATFSPEIFRFTDARAAYFVDGYRLRDGSFASHPDLLIDFADGRRLSANAVGDGGTSPTAKLSTLLLDKSHLAPKHFRTVEELP